MRCPVLLLNDYFVLRDLLIKMEKSVVAIRQFTHDRFYIFSMFLAITSIKMNSFK